MILNSHETKLILLLRNMSIREKLELTKESESRLMVLKRHRVDLDKIFLAVGEEE